MEFQTSTNYSDDINLPMASTEEHVSIDISDTSIVEESDDNIDHYINQIEDDCANEDNDNQSEEGYDNHVNQDNDSDIDKDCNIDVDNENQSYDSLVEEEGNHQSDDDDDDDDDNDNDVCGGNDDNDVCGGDMLMDDFSLNQNAKQPLYNGTDITTCAAICLIMHFALCNSLTNEAIERLLKLLHLLLPSPNHLPKSYYKFKAFFNQFSVPYKHSEVCTTCNKCTEDCHCQSPRQTTSHLLQISIVKPLTAVISKNWKSLQFFSSNTDNILRDVWDGVSMKSDNNSNKTIHLLVSTDGVPLFKSSTVSLWPVSFAILNLPPTIRINSENIILSGFWVGNKPVMKLLFAPILDNLSHLTSSGLEIRISSVVYNIFVKLAMGVFDLPTKAAVLNAKQFNGKHGCSVCLHPGNRLSNNSRIYPPHHYRERTHIDVMVNAETA